MHLHPLLQEGPGAAIISGVPTEDNLGLLEIATALGPVTAQGAVIPGNPLEDARVYRVEPLNQGNGVRDEAGLLIFSTTDQEFAPHTDGYHNKKPPAYVLMLCVRSDLQHYGQTTVIDGWQAVRQIDEKTLNLLSQCAYPAQFGMASLLRDSPSGVHIRFNMWEIARFDQSGILSCDHRDAAYRFTEVLAATSPAWSFTLAAGECLILDNYRALHGRSRLSQTNNRLLKRVWVEVDPARKDP